MDTFNRPDSAVISPNNVLNPNAKLHLGRLTRSDLRSIWANESSDFTPWLAQPDNIALLGEALGLQLEVEARERPVGPFRADILCRDVETDHWVLVENQLERTDHGHLGQLLTYASGLEAVTIVWIAGRFIEEHRSTLDWLNRITNESVRFFGLEVELWQIGHSAAAPKFNIVCKPNNWSHAIAQAARALDDGELSETRIMQRDYWAALNGVLDAVDGPVSGSKTPRPRAWISYPIGRSRFRLAAVMVRAKCQVRAELYIGGSDAKTYFHLLHAQKDAIERELGSTLEWEELPEKQACRVAAYLDDAEVEDSADWPRQQRWLAERLNAMHRVLAPRVDTLTLNDRNPDGIE